VIVVWYFLGSCRSSKISPFHYKYNRNIAGGIIPWPWRLPLLSSNPDENPRNRMESRSPERQAPRFLWSEHGFDGSFGEEWLRIRRKTSSSPLELWIQGEPYNNIDISLLPGGTHSLKTPRGDIHPDRLHSIQPSLSIVSMRPVFSDILEKDGCWDWKSIPWPHSHFLSIVQGEWWHSWHNRHGEEFSFKG